MNQKLEAKKSRARRRFLKIRHHSKKLRLRVYRSNRFISAQIIDDQLGKTLFSVCSRELSGKKDLPKTDQARELGLLLSQKALKEKIETVVFDCGSYKFHGRVKSLAEGARQGGLKF